ncbi:MBL fold metallo-hydrolase [Xylophilus sp. GW821-FHT01B05]
MNPYYDAAKPHHRPDGFQNRYGDFTPPNLRDVLRWKREARHAGLPQAPREAPPTVVPDHAFLRANAEAGAAMQPALTFIGHSTMLAQLPVGTRGLTVLTDPVFSKRASPLSFAGPRRLQPPALTAAQLPHVDLVLISHNHYDHLDTASVRALAAQAGGPPLFIVPLGIGPWLARQGIPGAVELDWWDTHLVEAGNATAEITLTPAQHWSGRGLRDRLATLWGGFAVLAPEFHLFFAGDTGYSPDFADIRAHFATRQAAAQGGGFDAALIPVGAYDPRWFMREQHVDPPEAVQIHHDLGAKRSIGIHWGTFALTDEALDQPPRDLATARAAQGLTEADFSVMAIGETRRLPRRTISPPPSKDTA